MPLAVAYHDIGTPPPKGRRARVTRAAPRAPPKAPSRVPWTTGMAPPDAMVPSLPPPEPEPEAPLVRGRPRKREASTETVRYPSGPPRAKAKAKAKAKARAISAATVRYPSQEPGVILPTEEEADRTEVYLSKVKKKIIKPDREMLELRALVLAERVGQEGKPKKPRLVAKAKARPMIPVGSQGGKRPVIRKVRIASAPEASVLKRGRGRPKGALGKAKRDAASSATPL